ncbi:S41 family peptidase [Mesonia sp. MT50]|uniref:S41 family peptidase n=1 Tax=Mesonia profundi TaxID=3070998 RepID=A0ABU1A4C5_9FLAO|nr:S41 family peptidase [Mesonia profundi]MDQ7918540.1 S41 family peptidase [Mesonia profundi]
MKKLSCLLLLILTSLSISSCFKDLDDERIQASDQDIQGFIYKVMSRHYLYKGEKSVLADEKFPNKAELDAYLNTFNSPKDLFSDLLFSQDRFSFLVDNYRELEQQFNGTTKNNGMEFGLVKIQSSGEVFGYVRYVLPNTSAEQNQVERGMIFNRVDNQTLTATNFNDLLTADTYSIGLATFEDGTLTPLESSINLQKQEYTENPIFIAKTLTVEQQKIGYLMYNGFRQNFDAELNNAFADFKADGIQDLVIDVRYNGGGSIELCNDLSSMVTGQFNGELFSTQVYNQNFGDKKILFNTKISSGASINSLYLSKVYVLTTGNTASASELLISSLMPYIDVVQVGATTLGKFQGSRTFYDSQDFSRNGNNLNLGHEYAVQPLILKSVNANGFTDYVDGLAPDIEIDEDFSSLGILGDPNETLLKTAIDDILGNGRPSARNQQIDLKNVGESKMYNATYQRMYVEN